MKQADCRRRDQVDVPLVQGAAQPNDDGAREGEFLDGGDGEHERKQGDWVVAR